MHLDRPTTVVDAIGTVEGVVLISPGRNLPLGN
jgi:hypothetical protein